jgi:hypothetical protein
LVGHIDGARGTDHRRRCLQANRIGMKDAGLCVDRFGIPTPTPPHPPQPPPPPTPTPPFPYPSAPPFPSPSPPFPPRRYREGSGARGERCPSPATRPTAGGPRARRSTSFRGVGAGAREPPRTIQSWNAPAIPHEPSDEHGTNTDGSATPADHPQHWPILASMGLSIYYMPRIRSVYGPTSPMGGGVTFNYCV